MQIVLRKKRHIAMCLFLSWIFYVICLSMPFLAANPVYPLRIIADRCVMNSGSRGGADSMESPEESADNLFIGVLQSHKSGIRSISSVLLFLLSVFAFCLLIFYLRYKSLFELRFIRNGIIMFLHKKDGMK